MVEGVFSQLHYTVQEEQEHGTFVGNIAEDLGLDITKLSARRFQTVPNSRTPYLDLNLETGVLYVNEKIDREQICKQSPSCVLHLEVFLENPLELFRVEIEVLDINDNPPSFPEPDLTVEISESATPGTRFPLESAFDPDVGTNSLRDYEITPNSYFSLDVQTQGDGNRFAELPVYTVSLPENSPPGTLVIQLNATDPDEGQNGEVVYSFSSHISPRARELFGLSPRTGRLEVSGELDYEESPVYQVYVQAKDLGPNAVPAHCKVLVRVLDANDNAPEISFSTVKEAVSEGAAPGTVVALFSVTDRDSEENGQVQCELLGDVPFRLKSSFKNYYTIVTEAPLDREAGDSYTLTVVARDRGEPALSTSKSIQVQVSDVNDNAPRFHQPVYDVYVTENNVPGAYIYAVSATDRDEGANAQLAYSILECQIQGMSIFTYVSINSENGYLYALRSFDYEQLKDFSFQVEARDAGSPQALAGNATVNILIRPNRSGGAETSLDLTLILIIALGSVSFIFLLAMIVLAVRCQKEKKLNIYTCLASDCCLCCCCGGGGSTCCGRQARARKKKLSKSDIMLVQSSNVTSNPAQVPVEESGGFGSHHHNQNYCYQVCLTPESAKTDLMFLKPCSPSRSTDTEHNPCGAIVTGYTDQQPDIISNGSILSNETKHQRAELSYLVDRPRRVNSSAFQEADIVSSKDSGHGDSEQGDSDHDATNRGQSAGMDLFSNCTEECKALGHSDRCWMPSFVPSDGRQAADYRSNLHVPGMDSVPDAEVFEAPEAPGAAERSFSTFGKEKALHSSLERKELDGLLSSMRAPYKPPYLSKYSVKGCLKLFPVREESSTRPAS
ncbi:Protocadherin-10 [Myotis davidii]|uniref:Protocadherin-10 n=1 Tax=Myotis davidii TaxID=225400 RepID=L5LWT0_MYODS|nr:Protocadherin-10 [Myotis davidii]